LCILAAQKPTGILSALAHCARPLADTSPARVVRHAPSSENLPVIFARQPRQNPQEILRVHVLRTADNRIMSCGLLAASGSCFPVFPVFLLGSVGLRSAVLACGVEVARGWGGWGGSWEEDFLCILAAQKPTDIFSALAHCARPLVDTSPTRVVRNAPSSENLPVIFAQQPRQNPQEILRIHVLRTADNGILKPRAWSRRDSFRTIWIVGCFRFLFSCVSCFPAWFCRLSVHGFVL
jgi:chorismate mutase